MNLFIAEFFGTMILLIFGSGVVAGVVLKGTKSNGGGWIVISFGWGLGVAVAVYAVGYISGAHINPAVTVSEFVAGNVSLRDAAGYIVAQMLGAGVGSSIVFYMYYPHYKIEKDAEAKLATFSTGPAVRHTPSNFFSEAVGTFVLLFGIQGINAAGSGVASGLGPLLVGLLVVGIGLALGGTTGYAINPARDLGPRIAHFLLPIPGKGSSDWNYSWIPVVGPLVGGTLGLLSYQTIFKGRLVFELIVTLGVFLVLQAATSFITLDQEA
jgi:glycerol uptake facilitator protein